MNKKLLSMAIAIFAAGAVMSAQTPQAEQNNNTKTEQTSKKAKDNDKKGDRKGPRMGRQGHRGHGPNFFEGIELTSEQKTALKNLREKEMANREQAMKERKANAEKNRQEMEKNRQALMAEHDNAIKQILTPEQYTKYQANVEAAKARQEKMQGRQVKGDRKDGQPNQRPERNKTDKKENSKS